MSDESTSDDLSGEPTSEDLTVEAERFAEAIAEEVEERRNEREKETIARNEKLAFLRETLEAVIKHFDDVKDGYARIEEEYVALDDMWVKFKMKMYAIALTA